MNPPPDAEKGRFRRLGRRLLGEDGDGKPLRVEAREILGAFVEGSDKAKSEIVRAVAREVRNYLEELGLKEDVHNLVTNYSFEVRASVHLRRLAEDEKGPRGEARGETRSEGKGGKPGHKSSEGEPRHPDPDPAGDAPESRDSPTES
jgi:hypothetical protein